MSFAGLGFWPISPPARGGHCTLVGGYMRKEQATQAEQPRRRSKRQPRQLRLGCEARVLAFVEFVDEFAVVLAVSPFLAKRIQNEFCGIGFLAHKPAGPCAALHPGRWVYEKRALPAGGMPGSPWAPLRGSPRGQLSPISYIAAFAWCPTVCRGTDDCGEHHPSTASRHLGRL